MASNQQAADEELEREVIDALGAALVGARVLSNQWSTISSRTARAVARNQSRGLAAAAVLPTS